MAIPLAPKFLKSLRSNLVKDNDFCECKHLKDFHEQSGCICLVHGLDFDGMEDEPCLCTTWYAS